MRDPRLRKLSIEHRKALTFAREVRQAIASGRWNAVQARQLGERFDAELEPHFVVEEDHIFAGLQLVGHGELAARAEADHNRLRKLARAARGGSLDAAHEFADCLREHVGFEERDLFPCATQHLPPHALDQVAGGTPPPYARPRVRLRDQIRGPDQVPPSPSGTSIRLCWQGVWQGYNPVTGVYMTWQPQLGEWVGSYGSGMTDPARVAAFYDEWAKRCRAPAAPKTWNYSFWGIGRGLSPGLERVRAALIGDGSRCSPITHDSDGQYEFSAQRLEGLTREGLLAVNDRLRALARAADVAYSGPRFPPPA